MIKNIFRYIRLPFTGISFLYGTRRVRKWIKKNEKMQDYNYHDYDKRWNYVVKKSQKILNALNIKIVLENEDYKPKGSFLMVANHTSNIDAIITIAMLGKTSPATSIAKQSLGESIIKGYMNGAESFYVYPKNPRKSLISFNKAGDWAKKNNRGVVIFPEGKRNWDGVMSDFSAASFKISQRNYLPIYVVSYIGVLNGLRWLKFKPNEVKIIFHPPIKASEASKISTVNISDKAKQTIEKDIEKYYDSLKPSELEKLQKFQAKRRKKQTKFEKKVELRNNKSKRIEKE